MKQLCVVLAATAMFGFGASSFAAADDVAVIVHKSNPLTTMTVAQLRAILLGSGVKWTSGGRITVILTAAGQPERTRALRVVCGMSETDYNMSFIHGWRNPDGSFNSVGAERPTVVGTGLGVRDAVASKPNALGLINASQVDGSVKALTIDGSRPGEPAYKIKFD